MAEQQVHHLQAPPLHCHIEGRAPLHWPPSIQANAHSQGLCSQGAIVQWGWQGGGHQACPPRPGCLGQGVVPLQPRQQHGSGGVGGRDASSGAAASCAARQQARCQARRQCVQAGGAQQRQLRLPGSPALGGQGWRPIGQLPHWQARCLLLGQGRSAGSQGLHAWRQQHLQRPPQRPMQGLPGWQGSVIGRPVGAHVVAPAPLPQPAVALKHLHLRHCCLHWAGDGATGCSCCCSPPRGRAAGSSQGIGGGQGGPHSATGAHHIALRCCSLCAHLGARHGSCHAAGPSSAARGVGHARAIHWVGGAQQAQALRSGQGVAGGAQGHPAQQGCHHHDIALLAGSIEGFFQVAPAPGVQALPKQQQQLHSIHVAALGSQQQGRGGAEVAARGQLPRRGSGGGVRRPSAVAEERPHLLVALCVGVRAGCLVQAARQPTVLPQHIPQQQQLVQEGGVLWGGRAGCCGVGGRREGGREGA